VADEETGQRSAPRVQGVAGEEIMSETVSYLDLLKKTTEMPAGFLLWWNDKGKKLHEQHADYMPAERAAKYTAWEAWLTAQVASVKVIEEAE